MSSSTTPIFGRDAEQATLRALVAGARNGVGGALLITGDPGVGKTSLLTHLAADARGVTVVTLTGYEVESGLAYAALQRLGRALEVDVDALPDRQRTAIRVIAGQEEGPPPARGLVGLAVLSLLARAGDRHPIACLIDDAQHLDAESVEALGFVSRRLAAESVAIAFASREDDEVAHALAGIPTLPLEGIGTDAAARLLQRFADAELDPAIVADLVAQTAGNPLALTEIASASDPWRLTATTLSGSPAPIGSRLEAHYAELVAHLSDDARRWLLTAAAESTGDARIVFAAARAQGVDPAVASEIEATGLVEIRDVVQFRHPLVRSAVYTSASSADRRTAHAALRVETAARSRPDVSAWHAAAAAIDGDAEVVAELVSLAERAGARGGLMSQARLLARAAELSDGAARDALRVGAAEAALGAGAARLALELSAGLADAQDPMTRGRALFVRAMAGLFLSDPEQMRTGVETLLAAADAFHGRAPELEQRVLLQSLNLVEATEQLGEGISLTDLGTRFASAADAADTPLAVMLRAVGSFILDPYEVAVPQLRAAVRLLAGLDDATLLQFSFAAVTPGVGLWDIDAAASILERAATVAREAGALRELDAMLWVLSAVELGRANPARAGEYLEQAKDLRRAVGYGEELVVNAAHLVWIGTPSEAVAPIGEALRAAGWAGVTRMLEGALAIADIADGEFSAAYDRLVPLVDNPFLQSSLRDIPELVEAGVRSGHREEAERTADLLARYAAAAGTPWITGLHERALALLAWGPDAEEHHRASIAHLDRTGVIGERGRARLLYGEWLRRARRRREARDQLHAALEIFESTGAVRFAARAQRELRASGESAPVADRADSGLTEQEAAIAALAAGGATNVEIGAAMLISPNTVDYHLRKIYRRLGVTSRRQLAERMQRPSP